MDELRENRDLMKKGDGDSSSGSDDAPSEDNLKPDEIVKVLPVVDKKTKADLAKQKKVKEKELKEQKSKKNLNIGAKNGRPEESKLPQTRKTIVAPVKEEKIEHTKKEEEKKSTKPKPVMVDACT
jgi:hypothetical protein